MTGINLPDWLYAKAVLAYKATDDLSYFPTDEEVVRQVLDAVKGDIVRHALSYPINIKAAT